jgi:hypothetical protein
MYLPIILLTACGNPGGISDEDYQKYQELGAPKILYSCTSTVDRRYTLAGIKELEACIETEDLENLMKCAEKTLHEDLITDVKVAYVSGIGLGSTYNKLLTDAKKNCNGEFKILESKQ